MISHLRNQVKILTTCFGPFHQFTDLLCGFMTCNRCSNVALMTNKIVNPSIFEDTMSWYHWTSPF